MKDIFCKQIFDSQRALSQTGVKIVLQKLRPLNNEVFVSDIESNVNTRKHPLDKFSSSRFVTLSTFH